MYFLGGAGYDDSGGPFLYIKDDSLADDLSHSFGAIVADVTLANLLAIAITALLAGRLIGEFAALVHFAFKAVVTRTYRFAIGKTCNIALREQAKDRDLIANLNAILCSDINICNKVASQQIGAIP